LSRNEIAHLFATLCRAQPDAAVVGLRPQLSVQHVSDQPVEQAGQEGVIDAADQLGCLRRQRMERAVARDRPR